MLSNNVDSLPPKPDHLQNVTTPYLPWSIISKYGHVLSIVSERLPTENKTNISLILVKFHTQDVALTPI